MYTDGQPAQQPMIPWMFQALGLYSILLPLLAIVCFIVTLVILFRGKGPMAAASLVLVVPMPFLLGLFAALQGAIASYSVIASSATTPKPADVAVGISAALIAPMVGLLLMAPSYLVASLGSFLRSLMTPADTNRV
jgi:hypothetical protein